MDAVWEWKEGEGNMEMMKCVFFSFDSIVNSERRRRAYISTNLFFFFFAEKNCYRPVTSATRCIDGSVQDNNKKKKKKKNIW